MKKYLAVLAVLGLVAQANATILVTSYEQDNWEFDFQWHIEGQPDDYWAVALYVDQQFLGGGRSTNGHIFGLLPIGELYAQPGEHQPWAIWSHGTVDYQESAGPIYGTLYTVTQPTGPRVASPAVPEPSTVLAAALLVFPMGLGLFRRWLGRR